ncbi:MAG: Glu-tRNA(Gln) amidotransferase subunit GatE [Candidatus Micrarchaeota archaeon]|nr:Glu-tRNA(Gln) amidotransferase subunit GatE [Candidatus Micrarchaeota archaeon]
MADNGDGIRIGLEIHQRLSTGKLFCRCPSESVGGPLFTITRRLHSVRSELGELDIASVQEEMRGKEFTYEVYPNNCLVELDEEPPHDIDRTALLVALAVSRYLGASIPARIYVMRKAVIDGSNTSGFQRTAIVSLGGALKSGGKTIGIQTLCLEEESAGIVDGGNGTRFALNRLGIPLIEIATEPCISSGDEARDVALAIGMMLRMTGMAARGIGTIRQDLNISIPGGARVEIKGVQELDEIPLIVENEVQRQKMLIGICRRIPAKVPEAVPADVTECIKNAKGWLAKAIAGGARAIAVKLPGLRGVMGTELFGGRRYGTEVSDYARPFGFGGMIHGDEDLQKYGIDRATVESALGVSAGDSYAILVGANGRKMQLALREIVRRAYMREVPAETRKSLGNGDTRYMRPMASGARMYPETDLQGIDVTGEMLHEAEKYVPKDPEVVLKELEMQTNRDLAEQLFRSKRLHAYLSAVAGGANPMIAAVTFTNTLKTLSREGLDTDSLDDGVIVEAIMLCSEGRITKKAVEQVLRDVLVKKVGVREAIELGGLKKVTGKELDALIASEGDDPKAILSKYRLQVDAEELMKKIGKKDA